jgi:hypothetical protein
MSRHGLLALALLPGLAHAASWEFSPAIEVTGVHGSGIFHHLESAGRRSIAVSGDRVAITWEDERDATPRVYLASKRLQDASFSTLPEALSDGTEAYEPGIAAVSNGRFAVAWEQDGSVRVRIVAFATDGSARLGTPVSLSGAPAGQVSLAASPGALLATWTEQTDKVRQVRYARLPLGDDLALMAPSSCNVDGEAATADQLYPTVAATPAHTVVAWEDRRPGHTIIMAAHAAPGDGCAFSPPVRISEEPPGPPAPYGKGHGVSRVALASHGEHGLLAAWADKRDFRHGYDIWGTALQADGSFGANQKLQDDFSELSQQWHTALAGHPNGLLVAAWDDNREGNADVMISWPRQDGSWSDDLPVPVAAGPGEQVHPSIAFDAEGRLHLAWVHRDSVGGPTRLLYSVARFNPEQ